MTSSRSSSARTLTTIKVANAPCSWSALEFELSSKPKGFERVLDEIRASGYTGTELGHAGFMPSEPTRLKYELEKRDLQMVAAFIPIAFANRVHTPTEFGAQ
jgi:inosose dehydratase